MQITHCAALQVKDFSPSPCSTLSCESPGRECDGTFWAAHWPCMLHKQGLYTNIQNNSCTTESCSCSKQEDSSPDLTESLKLRKHLQPHNFFHYMLVSLASQAESRAHLLYPTAQRQMTVTKGNFQLLQKEATLETPSAGARQAAEKCRLSLTSHTPALALH